MITIHSVQIDEELPLSSPLHVSNFFPLRGMWWTKRKARQALILGIASAWYKTVSKHNGGYGFIEEEVYLTALTSQVSDIRPVFEKFFHIKEVGYSFGNGLKSATKCTPKKIPAAIKNEIDRILNQVKFYPGPEPSDKGLVLSHSRILTENAQFVRSKLIEEEREDLLPMVNWLFNQDSLIKFYYKSSGKLKARETSVWPIRCIEQWPGWLRSALFGTIVDIETSFCQYVMSILKEKYATKPNAINLKYPDIVRLLDDKTNFRNELAEKYLRLGTDEESIKVVKKILMALANGSTCSRGLMLSDSPRSTAVQLVRENCPHLSLNELAAAGDRLHSVVNQFRNAKRAICIFKYQTKPTRENMKRIFKDYFVWERQARRAIWDAVGQTGLMLHDGVDGIITDMSERELEDYIVSKTSIRVSVEKPKLEALVY